jgi:AcrR family transcriptional regulator
MSHHASVNNLDMRSQKSWHKVRLALEELVLTKRYDEITTSEIIERAGVARSTFYEHFSNKEDILGKSLYPPLMVLAKCVNEDSNEESLRQILHHFWEHRSFCRLILTGAARKSVNRILIDALNDKIIDNLKKSNRKIIISTYHAAAQIGASQLTLMEIWLLGKAKSSDENLAFTMKKTSLGLLNALVQDDI